MPVYLVKRKYLFLAMIIGMYITFLTGCRSGLMTNPANEDADVSGVDSTENSITETGSEQDETETESEVTIIPEEMPQLPDTGKRLVDFVPEGWDILDSVELDFNEDGMKDYVGVLDCRDYPRILFAIASDGTDEYRLDFQDINLIRTRAEGGVYGDPYEPLTAEGVTFTTHAYGGSAWRWSEDYTYTYYEGVWRLTSSEDSYGYYEYTTSYNKNDWESGVGIRKRRSDQFSDMEKKWDEVEIENWDTIEYDIEYELSLDEPLTLEQVGKRWWLAPDRVTDWEVEFIILGKDVEILEDMVKLPSETNLIYRDYCDEDCVLYVFSDSNKEFNYIAMYRWEDKVLSVLAQEESIIDDLTIYKGKIYYSTEIVENIAYKTVEDGKEQIKEEEDTVGLMLNRMDLDGTGKETIFVYHYPKEGQEMRGGIPYLVLNYELSGDEIIVEVYIGNEPHPFYRMNIDGSGLKVIGQMPVEK